MNLTPADPPPPGAAASRRAPAIGSWKYRCIQRSRMTVLIALALSGAMHAGLLLGTSRRAKPVPKAKPVPTLELALVMPKLEEEEPEVPVSDGEAVEEAGVPVPTLADTPTLPRPDDFVQKLDFASLVEKPDFSEMKVLSIPENIRRGSGKIGDGMANLFNLADLDRVPEPLFQPAPMVPAVLRREGGGATVTVVFIVDINGRVVSATVVESTDARYNEAAINGVGKWKFRAGMKAGRKVNTRMRVPLVFTVVDPSVD